LEVYHIYNRTNLTVPPNTLTVNIDCLDGGSGIPDPGALTAAPGPHFYFSGTPQYNIRRLRNGNIRVSINRGSFRKSIRTFSWWRAPAQSQYARMVRAEEQYHERQIRGTAGNVIRNFWNVNDIIRNANAAGPFEDPDSTVALANAQAAFDTARRDEIVDSNRQAFTFAGRRCDVEREAKRAVRASFFASIGCTYPGVCP